MSVVHQKYNVSHNTFPIWNLKLFSSHIKKKKIRWDRSPVMASSRRWVGASWASRTPRAPKAGGLHRPCWDSCFTSPPSGTLQAYGVDPLSWLSSVLVKVSLPTPPSPLSSKTALALTHWVSLDSSGGPGERRGSFAGEGGCMRGQCIARAFSCHLSSQAHAAWW